MSFRDECDQADRRYRAGKDPIQIEPERWAKAREAKRKLRSGAIPSSWDRPEWTLDRLYWHFQRSAEQARLRARAKPGDDKSGA